jgi:hypothetical protein
MVATATESTDKWVLLEVTGGWAPKAPATKGLPTAVTKFWDMVSEVPRARMQFIKQSPRSSASRRIFVGTSGPNPWWVTWLLPNLEAVADIDVSAIWQGHLPPQAEKVTQPIYLVCTHGKRDECCAKYGMAMYRSLRQHDSSRVWQASHIGGHRFAATLLAFPTGHCFGRLSPQDADRLFQDYELGALWSLNHVRGRTSFSRPEQAAIHFLRVQKQVTGLNDITVRSTTLLSSGREEWNVTLMIDDRQYLVNVQTRFGNEVQGSCFKEKRQLAVHWVCSLSPAG